MGIRLEFGLKKERAYAAVRWRENLKQLLQTKYQALFSELKP